MSKTRIGIDPLHPFVNSNSNRSEVFYVEFDGFICNRAMNVLSNLLLSSDFEVTNWFIQYPFINTFCGMKSDDLFHITKMYNPYELLYEINNAEESSKRTDEEIFADIKILESKGYVKYQQVTSFAFALKKMLQENCISKVYIQKEYEFYEWEKLFLKELFDPYLSKLELLEGPSFYAFKEVKDEVTTSFINFPQMCDQLIAEFGSDELKKKLFLLRSNNHTLQFNEELERLDYIDPNITEKYKEKGLQVGIIFTESINEDPLNEVIVAG